MDRRRPVTPFADLPREEQRAIVDRMVADAIAAGTHSEGPPLRVCDGCREWKHLVHGTFDGKSLCLACWGMVLCPRCRRWVDRLAESGQCRKCSPTPAGVER